MFSSACRILAYSQLSHTAAAAVVVVVVVFVLLYSHTNVVVRQPYSSAEVSRKKCTTNSHTAEILLVAPLFCLVGWQEGMVK